MPKITIDITKPEQDILDALADIRGETIPALFAPWLRDLLTTAVGIAPDDTPDDRAYTLAKLQRKAAKAKAERALPTPAPESILNP
jgi:hypothetical protein